MKKLERYLINFDELKVGDVVWNVIEGETKIIGIVENENYPIKTEDYSYTKNGFIDTQDKFPSIYKSNPFENLKEEPRMIEVEYINGWEERELIDVIDGTAIYWSKERYVCSAGHMYWREIQREVELTDKERITELEREVAELKNNLRFGSGKIIVGTSIDDIPTRDYLYKTEVCGTTTTNGPLKYNCNL